MLRYEYDVNQMLADADFADKKILHRVKMAHCSIMSKSNGLVLVQVPHRTFVWIYLCVAEKQTY